MAIRVTILLLFSLVVSSCSSRNARKELAHSPKFDSVLTSIRLGDNVDLLSLDGLEPDCVETENSVFVPELDHHYVRAWWCHSVEHNDRDAVLYAQKALSIIDDLSDSSMVGVPPLVADMEYLLGVADYGVGDISSSFRHLQRSLDKSREVGYVDMQIAVPLFLSGVGCDLGDVMSSLTQLRTVETIMDTADVSRLDVSLQVQILSGCAGTAIDLCDAMQADRLLSKASLLYDKANDRAKMACLMQNARLRMCGGQYSQAASTLSRVDMLSSKSGDPSFLADLYALHGLARSRMGELEGAEQFLEKAVAAVSAGAKVDRTVLCLLRGEVLMLQHKLTEARTFVFDSVSVLAHTNFDVFLSHESQRTYDINKGDFERAYFQLADDRRQAETLQNEVFAFNDRKRNDALRSIDASHTSEIGELYRRIGGLVADAKTMVVVFALLLLLAVQSVRWLVHYRERRIRRSVELENEELKVELNDKILQLESQAKMLENTNERISDSISYAEHIQHSMSPDPAMLNSYPISGSFIFYSPLDVVSGDFFWFTRRGDSLFICCADCTGHGVPGAFMSMMAATILNGICDRMGRVPKDPGAILEELDSSIISNLSHNTTQSGASKDGLDIAICSLNLLNHKLSTAAARRPVVVVKDGVQSTIKGTRRSIGDLDPVVRTRKFENTVIQMSKGDRFYMYTDGYSDQFGGQGGEKMRNSTVERFLSTVDALDMDEQSLTIQELFTQWKGDYPQTDDVLFIGVMV